MKTPKDVADAVFDKNWNHMGVRELMAEAIKADRSQVIDRIEEAWINDENGYPVVQAFPLMDELAVGS